MTGWILLLGLLTALGLAAAAAVLHRGLVIRRRRAESAWAQVDGHLRCRCELIPKVVEAVRAYATSEHETLEAATRARAAAVEARGVVDQARAQDVVTVALRPLLSMAETRPDLLADQGNLSLQEELSATHGRIAYARRFYNATVAGHNARLRSFPARLVAGPLRVRAQERFEADVGPCGPVAVEV